MFKLDCRRHCLSQISDHNYCLFSYIALLLLFSTLVLIFVLLLQRLLDHFGSLAPGIFVAYDDRFWVQFYFHWWLSGNFEAIPAVSPSIVWIQYPPSFTINYLWPISFWIWYILVAQFEDYLGFLDFEIQ